MMAKAATLRKAFAVAAIAASLSLVSFGGQTSAWAASHLNQDVASSSHEGYGAEDVRVPASLGKKEPVGGQMTRQRSSSRTAGHWRVSSTGNSLASKLLLATSALAAMASLFHRGRSRGSEADELEQLVYSPATAPAGLSLNSLLSPKLILGLMGLLFVASSLAAPTPATNARTFVNVAFDCERNERTRCTVYLPRSKSDVKQELKFEDIDFQVVMSQDIEARLKAGNQPSQFLNSVYQEIRKILMGDNLSGNDWSSISGEQPVALPEGLEPEALGFPPGSTVTPRPEVPTSPTGTATPGTPVPPALSAYVYYQCSESSSSSSPRCSVYLPGSHRGVVQHIVFGSGADAIDVTVAMSKKFRKLGGSKRQAADDFVRSTLEGIVDTWRDIEKNKKGWKNSTEKLHVREFAAGLGGVTDVLVPTGLRSDDFGGRATFSEATNTIK